MEMIRDALRPEQLEIMRKLLEGENKTVTDAVPIRKKRDFEEEAGRAAFKKRRKARA